MIKSLCRLGWTSIVKGRIKCVSKKIISKSINQSKKYVKVTSKDLGKGRKWVIGTCVSHIAHRLERYIQFTNRLEKGAVKWIAGVTLESIAKNLSISTSKAHRILKSGNFVRKQNFKNLYVIEKSMFASHLKYNDLNFPFSTIELKNNSSKILVRRRLGSSYYPL